MSVHTVKLKDDKTWVYVKIKKNPGKPAHAVEVWDTTFSHTKINYSKAVTLQLHYKNNLKNKVIGVSVKVIITNPFGKVVLNDIFNDEVILQPNERYKAKKFWYWKDNQFISDQPYDKMWNIAANGTAKINTKVLKVVCADGTVIK